jgi:benzoylformate decarboxylase
VQGTVDPLHPNFRGQLPPTTKEINEILSRYHTMLLVGEKVDTFTYDGCSAMPGELQMIQIAPATSQLGFDYPCDVAVLGEIKATLSAIAAELGTAAISAVQKRTADVAALEAKYPPSGKRPSDALILGVLRHLDRTTHVVTEGSVEDAIVQDMAVGLGFRNVHFSPRGGGLGWAMPLCVGIGLATGKPYAGQAQTSHGLIRSRCRRSSIGTSVCSGNKFVPSCAGLGAITSLVPVRFL